MNLTPIKNNLIVKEQEQDQVSSGGILLPESIETHRTCVVLASACNEIQTGDIVHMPRRGGVPIQHNGEDIIVVKYEDLLCFENI